MASRRLTRAPIGDGLLSPCLYGPVGSSLNVKPAGLPAEVTPHESVRSPAPEGRISPLGGPKAEFGCDHAPLPRPAWPASSR